jgi:hypothetical protein
MAVKIRAGRPARIFFAPFLALTAEAETRSHGKKPLGEALNGY